MARPNDTVAPPRANRNETNDDNPRENRRSSIFIDDDENEKWHMVTLEEFLQFASEKPEWLYKKLRLIHQRYEECLDEQGVHRAEREFQDNIKDGEIALLRLELEEVKGQLQDRIGNYEHVRQQLAESESECDAYSRRIAKMTIQLTNSGNWEPTPATTSVRKTTKISDPPVLTDGKEPRFEDWLLLISQKLAANADHFDTPQLRKAYVVSRCEGKARKHIIPRMRDDAMNPYTDSKDMLNHLKTIYDDPNRVTTAKHQFRQLYMKASDKFHNFLSEFLYLAVEAGVAEHDWKDELYHKLTTELQKLCITASIQNSSFQEFSSAVSQTASRLEVINHRTQRNRSFAPSNRDTTNKGTSQSGTAVKKEPTPSQGTSPTTQRMGNAEHDRLMKEGRCFHCQEHGHLARDCPTKASTSELKELEQKAPVNVMNDDAGKV